jgi:hypothetical protein
MSTSNHTEPSKKKLSHTSDEKKPQEIINKDTIRPSHIEDKNIIYKPSGYLKDLIGEGK